LTKQKKTVSLILKQYDYYYKPEEELENQKKNLTFQQPSKDVKAL